MGEKIQGADGITYEVDEDDNLGLPLEEEPRVPTQLKAEAAEDPDEGDEEEPANEEDADLEEDEDDFDPEEAEAELDAFLEARVVAKLQPQLTGRDRQITHLQAELKVRDERMAEIEKQLRENSLINLSDEDKVKQRQIWDYEDKMKGLKDYEAANNDMYLAMLRMAHVQDNGEMLGLTEDELEGMDEAEMDSYVQAKELAFWRAGGPKVEAAPAAKAKTDVTPAPPKRKVPAGSQAPSDIGGQGADLKPRGGGVAEGTGPEAMAKTLAGLKTETIRFPN